MFVPVNDNGHNGGRTSTKMCQKSHCLRGHARRAFAKNTQRRCRGRRAERTALSARGLTGRTTGCMAAATPPVAILTRRVFERVVARVVAFSDALRAPAAAQPSSAAAACAGRRAGGRGRPGGASDRPRMPQSGVGLPGLANDGKRGTRRQGKTRRAGALLRSEAARRAHRSGACDPPSHGVEKLERLLLRGGAAQRVRTRLAKALARALTDGPHAAATAPAAWHISGHAHAHRPKGMVKPWLDRRTSPVPRGALATKFEKHAHAPPTPRRGATTPTLPLRGMPR